MCKIVQHPNVLGLKHSCCTIFQTVNSDIVENRKKNTQWLKEDFKNLFEDAPVL